jgi:DNA-binding transcriptional ArsR family regulator
VPAHLDLVLRAAGEPTRLRLLSLLRQGAACVCELQATLGVPQPTVSRHLAALRAAGLVTCARRGTRVVYSLGPADSPQTKVLRAILARGCECEPVLRSDLARFRRVVRSGGGDRESRRWT